MEYFLGLPQRQRLAETMLKEFTEDERYLFFETVERTQLDPFSRQIYAGSRWNKQLGRNTLSIQVSIDGFRVLANRTGKYSGQLGPFWCGTDGKWMKDSDGHPLPWLSSDFPAAAMVGALRSDFTQPLFAIARWTSYVQTTKEGVGMFWKKMPDLMLGKVAEALALRRAFPAELSGLYTTEEMDQATNEPESKPHRPAQEKPVEPPKEATRPALYDGLATQLKAFAIGAEVPEKEKTAMADHILRHFHTSLKECLASESVAATASGLIAARIKTYEDKGSSRAEAVSQVFADCMTPAGS